MTEKEFKKLNRYQILELLIFQTERADSLQKQLDAAQEQLQKQDLRFANLGSIAEAALDLNGVFQAAQEAADMYLNAAKKRAEEIELEALSNAADILADAHMEARRIQQEAGSSDL